MNRLYRLPLRPSAAFLGVLALVACDDPLSLPQRIERTRVLAARVESQTDPSVAWPTPGNAAIARWLVVDPAETTRFTWDFRACSADAVNLGLPSCVGPPFATTRQEEPSVTVPTLPYETPETGLGTAVLLHGVVCSRGTPNASATGCVGEQADGDAVVLTVPLSEASGNRNPSLANDTISLDGEPWLAPDPAGVGCGGDVGSPAPPIVSSSTAHEVSIRLRGDRERVDSGEGSWETLQVVYAATGGTLERPYDYIESGDSAPEHVLHVRWEAPAAVGQGLRVRIYFVLRDLRGGSDWTRRDVCVVPST